MGRIQEKKEKSKIRPHNVSNVIYLYMYKEHLNKMRVTVLTIVPKLRTGQLRNRGLFPGGAMRFLAAPEHPDRLWCHSYFYRMAPGIKWS
jgi:hypothetical protein